MINNNEFAENHKDSLGAAISAISHPFNTFAEKIECVTQKFHETKDISISLDEKKHVWRIIFKTYYDNVELYNHYGLTIVEPF